MAIDPPLLSEPLPWWQIGQQRVEFGCRRRESPARPSTACHEDLVEAAFRRKFELAIPHYRQLPVVCETAIARAVFVRLIPKLPAYDSRSLPDAVTI